MNFIGHGEVVMSLYLSFFKFLNKLGKWGKKSNLQSSYFKLFNAGFKFFWEWCGKLKWNIKTAQRITPQEEIQLIFALDLTQLNEPITDQMFYNSTVFEFLKYQELEITATVLLHSGIHCDFWLLITFANITSGQCDEWISTLTFTKLFL